VLYAKAFLLVVIGLLSAGLLFARNPDPTTASFIVLSVWAFSRAYYFAFYVIERYVDPTFRFSGLLSFLRYVLFTRVQRGTKNIG
jgi:hypothetical protein